MFKGDPGHAGAIFVEKVIQAKVTKAQDTAKCAIFPVIPTWPPDGWKNDSTNV
jgi:hypothetical protein